MLSSLILLSFLAFATGSKDCPANWVAYDGSCYYFQQSKVRLTQESAAKHCNAQHEGSGLAAIETVGEFNFLKSHLASIYPSIRHSTTNGWLISGKRVSGGAWKWTTTGSAVDNTTFTWGRGEPNGQPCLALWPAHSFNMADVFCSSFDRQFICEI